MTKASKVFPADLEHLDPVDPLVLQASRVFKARQVNLDAWANQAVRARLDNAALLVLRECLAFPELAALKVIKVFLGSKATEVIAVSPEFPAQEAQRERPVSLDPKAMKDRKETSVEPARSATPVSPA